MTLVTHLWFIFFVFELLLCHCFYTPSSCSEFNFLRKIVLRVNLSILELKKVDIVFNVSGWNDISLSRFAN